MEFDYRKSIRANYEKRRAKNNSYSLRAFARDLNISSTALHGVLGGKRQLSELNLGKVSQALGWSPLEFKLSLDFIEGGNIQASADEIFDHDRFRFISDWYYLPLLNLAKLARHKADEKWIAKKINLDINVVKEALKRLVRLKMLNITGNKLKRLIGSIGTTEDFADAAKINYYQQTLKLSADKYQSVAPSRREYTSITVPIATDDLPKLKRKIREFREEFLKSASSKNPDEIYQLNIQMFPVTEKNEDEL